MKQSDFLNNFISALYQKINKRNQLVSFISETLEIERESASRRLNQKVSFSIEEMGTLALKLGISLDGLLYSSGEHFHFPSFMMYSPMKVQSINSLTLAIESDVQHLGSILLEPTEYGCIFTYPPLEFVIPYKHLLKFTYFKWGYYYVGSADFENFSKWHVPKNLLRFNDQIVNLNSKLAKMLYIWDSSTIWSFVNDINYFASIGFLTFDDAKIIKDELHNLLYDFEEKIKKVGSSSIYPREIDVYVSEVNIGADFSYLISQNKKSSNFHTYFAGTGYNNDYKTTMQLSEWMNSMKKVCSLISGSGTRERKHFFNQQHKIVDTITSD